MTLFTYDIPRPRPFPNAPDSVDDLPDLPLPLPDEEPGEWGDPVIVEVEEKTTEMPDEKPAEDEPPGTLEDVTPDDPKDPLPGDKTMESGIPVKEPSPDTTESPD